MKIIEHKPDVAALKELKAGELFKHGPCYCMKIDSEPKTNNLVYLVDGGLGWLEPSTEVKKIKGSLVVE